MAVGVVRTAWSGTSGGPGVTQLYFLSGNGFATITAAEAQTAVNAVRTFWQAVASYLPDDILLTVSPVVDQYDIATNTLTSSVSASSAPATVVGTSSGSFAMASGMKVNLNTTNIRNGRRVRGGIYMVPASSAVYGANGTVGSAIRTAVNTAGQTMLNSLTGAGLQLVVYSRPVEAGEPNGPRAGGVSNVQAMETNEKGAVLRGRRD